jgi:hypothetical protein
MKVDGVLAAVILRTAHELPRILFQASLWSLAALVLWQVLLIVRP